MMSRKYRITLLATPVCCLLASCATIPSGPAVAVMPANGKTLAEFQNDDAVCRQFASQQVSGLTAQQAAETSAIKSAVVGTALGAAAGVAFGGGHGAAIGAGSGLLAGSAMGAAAGAQSAYSLQDRYDTAYSQCMVTQGNPLPQAPVVAAAPPAYLEAPVPFYGYAPYDYGYYHQHHRHHHCYW